MSLRLRLGPGGEQEPDGTSEDLCGDGRTFQKPPYDGKVADMRAPSGERTEPIIRT